MAGAFCDHCKLLLAHCKCLAAKIERPGANKPQGSVRQAILDDRPAKELFSSEDVELYFKSQRGKAAAKLRSAQDMLDGLNALLLAGQITGLELVKAEQTLNEIVRKQKVRFRMLAQQEDMAHKQRQRKGSAWV